MQSPLVGWLLSSVAVGRESPAVVFVPATIPRYCALWWQVWHPGPPRAPPMVAWPATVRVGVLMLAAPSLNPPALTLAVLWQPEPLQSSVPIGMWFPGLETIDTLRNVFATVGPGQLRQQVTFWETPVTALTAKQPAGDWPSG